MRKGGAPRKKTALQTKTHTQTKAQNKNRNERLKRYSQSKIKIGKSNS